MEPPIIISLLSDDDDNESDDAVVAPAAVASSSFSTFPLRESSSNFSKKSESSVGRKVRFQTIHVASADSSLDESVDAAESA